MEDEITGIIFILVLAILLTMAAVKALRYRGHALTLLNTLAILFAPIIVLIVVFLIPKGDHVPDGMRKCPSCQAMIVSKARVCRFCGREAFSPDSPQMVEPISRSSHIVSPRPLSTAQRYEITKPISPAIKVPPGGMSFEEIQRESDRMAAEQIQQFKTSSAFDANLPTAEPKPVRPMQMIVTAPKIEAQLEEMNKLLRQLVENGSSITGPRN